MPRPFIVCWNFLVCHQRMVVKNTFKFMRNKENPLECDAIIVDEASMIDANLFYVLLSAIPIGTRLILVGDTDQLPSVGAGSVLDDIIKSGVCPVVRLNRVFRQGEKSSIIGNAHKIRRGEQLKLTNDSEDFFYFQKQDERSCVEEIKSLVKERITKFSGIESKDIQVLTPLRKYGLGVEELNVQLQEVRIHQCHLRERRSVERLFSEKAIRLCRLGIIISRNGKCWMTMRIWWTRESVSLMVTWD